MIKATVVVAPLVVLLATGTAAASETVEGVVLAAAPAGGGFNTCEGSRATPQCLHALSRGEGAASTGGTAPPAPGATTSTAAPARGATSAATPANASSAQSPGWKTLGAAAASVGAALGLRSDEDRRREVEHERLMRESARTLEEVRRQQAREAAAASGAPARMELPAGGPGRSLAEPGGKAVPRGESGKRMPFAAPSTAGEKVLAEPDDEAQSALELSNPYGQHGKPDHQATVKRLTDLAEREFPDAEINTGTSIRDETGVNRRPDVWVFDPRTGRVLKVYEAARFNPDGTLPRREQLKKFEYDRAGIPSHFESVTP
jgi:hypothetical protein